MLSITKKVYYGMSAIMELSSHYGNGLLQIKTIASRRSIPKNYLEQILNRMLKAGLVKSTRGNQGGYELSETPDKITFLRVLEVLEGKIALTDHWPEEDAVHHMLLRTESKIKSSLNCSIMELAEAQKKLENNLDYII